MSVTAGTFPGVRIVDMPDLGAITDNSSLVGEHAGSGRFSALAMRTYIFSGDLPVISVLDHGARGDGVSDDTAAIQGTMNTYAGRAVVFVPETGTPYIVNTLSPPAGTDLLIHGTLKLIAAASNSLLQITAANVSIRGHGTLDGNGPAQVITGPGIATIGTSGCSNLLIAGVTLKNAKLWNLNVTASTRVRVDRVILNGGNNANEFAVGCDDCWITNSTIDGTGLGDYCFCFYGGVTNSGAVGNHVKNGGAGIGRASPGIGILSDNAGIGTNQPCHNIIIADNIIHDCGSSGISCISPASGGNQTGVLIANNRCYNNNGVLAVSVNADIFIDQSDNVTITGNQISANGAAAVTTPCGIFLGPNATRVAVLNNHIYNVGRGRTDGVGMWNAGTVSLLVSGNYVYDTQATPTMQYSVVGGAAAHTALIGNFFDRPYNAGSVADTVSANSVFGKWMVGGLTGADNVSVISGSAGHRASLQFWTQYFPRWIVGADGTAETGSSLGANYEITSILDDGTTQFQVLKINRSDGEVFITEGLHVGGQGITYSGGNYVKFSWNGVTVQMLVDSNSEGTLLTSTSLVGVPLSVLPLNAANDAAAATAGVPLHCIYRNGSVLQIRMA